MDPQFNPWLKITAMVIHDLAVGVELTAKSQNSTDCDRHLSAPGVWSTSSMGEPQGGAGTSPNIGEIWGDI